MKKIPTASNENRQPREPMMENIIKFIAMPAYEPIETIAIAVVET